MKNYVKALKTKKKKKSAMDLFKNLASNLKKSSNTKKSEFENSNYSETNLSKKFFGEDSSVINSNSNLIVNSSDKMTSLLTPKSNYY